MPDWGFEHGTPLEGYRIELYKTKDMSGKCNVMYTGVIFFEDSDDRALVICRGKFNGSYSTRAWKYESQQTIRKVLAAVHEVIDEAEGE